MQVLADVAMIDKLTPIRAEGLHEGLIRAGDGYKNRSRTTTAFRDGPAHRMVSIAVPRSHSVVTVNYAIKEHQERILHAPWRRSVVAYSILVRSPATAGAAGRFR